MEESIPVWVIVVYVLVGISSIGAMRIVAKSIKKSRQYVGDPSKKEVAMGFIQSVAETNWFVNNRPQLAISVMIFPLNEPPKTITVKQVSIISIVTDLPPVRSRTNRLIRFNLRTTGGDCSSYICAGFLL